MSWRYLLCSDCGYERIIGPGDSVPVWAHCPGSNNKGTDVWVVPKGIFLVVKERRYVKAAHKSQDGRSDGVYSV